MNAHPTPFPRPAARQIGYCTNVHAGVDLASIRNNLVQYAVPIRNQLTTTGDSECLGVGLWIPDQASRQLVGSELESFADFLRVHRLNAFTINGFPFANFHGDSVKQRVYLPNWARSERLEYTQRLAVIMAALLPEEQPIGSISTLPILWPGNPFADAVGDQRDRQTAGAHLRQLAKFLQRLLETTGKHIVVAIEPEPGCEIDTAADLIRFFDEQLPLPDERRFITVCHDICHSAVMNEPQPQAIANYRDAGIAIGKVQVSSAVVAEWETIPVDRYAVTLEQLSGFAEDRYLHQTGQVDRNGGFRLAEDLPQLLQNIRPADLQSMARWVIHFHVPIFLERFGNLTTSRDDVVACLKTLDQMSDDLDFTGHYEVETYAWTVLPEAMRRRGLADDIASELQWLIDLLR